jgi:hypothetical protein
MSTPQVTLNPYDVRDMVCGVLSVLSLSKFPISGLESLGMQMGMIRDGLSPIDYLRRS